MINSLNNVFILDYYSIIRLNTKIIIYFSMFFNFNFVNKKSNFIIFCDKN